MNTDPFYNDQELLSRLMQGEEPAMAQLFNSYFPRLFYFAETITGHTAEAEDIAIRALAKLWEQGRASTSAAIVNPGSWLFTVVRNLCYDYLKHQKVKQAGAGTLQQEMASPEEYIEAKLVQEDIMNKVYREISLLPAQCRKVAELIYIHGLSADEIAAILQVSASTVRSQKARALELLRTRFMKDKMLSLLIPLFF